MDTPPPRLRADAVSNRTRLLDAARELFATQGVDVSFRQIAAHASVSEATLRRRFESREALVAAAFQDKITRYAELAESALGGDDPWQDFADFMVAVAQMQHEDRGFGEVLTMTFPDSMSSERERVRAYTAIIALINRGKESGRLRSDFSPEDLVMVLMAHAGLISASGRLATTFSRRFLAYCLQAFSSQNTETLPPAPTASATYVALRRVS